jgi:hypothetical protein
MFYKYIDGDEYLLNLIDTPARILFRLLLVPVGSLTNHRLGLGPRRL